MISEILSAEEQWRQNRSTVSDARRFFASERNTSTHVTLYAADVAAADIGDVAEVKTWPWAWEYVELA